jgi:hypothetical protein
MVASQNDAHINLARLLAMHLWGIAVPEQLRRETSERPFQRWLGEEIESRLGRNYPEQFNVKIEPRGGKVLPVRAFATTFWPDISIESSAGDMLTAVEVKCVKRGNLPAQISQAIGQALMYQQLYRQSLVALIPLGQLVMPPPPFFANLSEHSIEMTVVGQIAGSGVDLV